MPRFHFLGAHAMHRKSVWGGQHIIALAFFAIAVLFLLSLYLRHGVTHTITVVEGSFSPDFLSVRPGDTVRFIAPADTGVWPASDPHPTHQEFPLFDPKQMLKPGAHWDIRFTHPGYFTYHDHIHPAMRGVIFVASNENAGVKICTHAPQGSACAQAQILDVLEREGVDSALKSVEQQYANVSGFATICHDTLHRIGEGAFRIEESGGKVTLSPSTAFCGYGFYHGLMEAMLLAGKTMTHIGDFCDNIYGRQNTVLGDACYHGIGHGAFLKSLEASTPPPTTQVFNDAIRTCEQATRDQLRQSRCASGVFMEGAQVLAGREGVSTPDHDDPYAICAQFSDLVRINCYTQLYPLVVTRSQGDFGRASTYVSRIADTYERTEAMRTLTATFAVSKADLRGVTPDACRALSRELLHACISGVALAILLNSRPNTEYASARAFCLSDTLTLGESGPCMEFVLRHMSGIYDKTRMHEICESTPEQLRGSACDGY